MTIKDMHYDFKKKLNKIDSQQNKNLLIPEIDWALNEAQEIFVKMIAFPRGEKESDFEDNQRAIDDIRTLIKVDSKSNVDKYELPIDYWHYVDLKLQAKKDNCTKNIKCLVREHEEDFESSYFDKSSFDWNIANITFVGNYINFHGEMKNVIIEKADLIYVKKLIYIHNAEDFRGNTYTLPNGTNLSGSVNCELPEHTHKEIVDIAVLMVSGELQMSDYQTKLMKIKLNNTK